MAHSTKPAPEVAPEGTEEATQPPAGGADSTPVEDTAKTDRDNALKAAYVAATRRLREDEKEKFNRYYAEEAEARGQEWKPKPTKEEKAKAEMEALLEQYPSLRETFGPQV